MNPDLAAIAAILFVIGLAMDGTRKYDTLSILSYLAALVCIVFGAQDYFQTLYTVLVR